MDGFHLAIGPSRARTAFKMRAGHTTQDLLTVIVGLDAVKAGARAEDALPARWDPKSKSDASSRARTFANQAALLWIVESLMGYVKELTRLKVARLPTALAEKIDTTRSKEEKLLVLSSAYGASDSSNLALLRAGYVWRNRLTHVGSTNLLDRNVRARLLDRSEALSADFQGLDVSEMIARIEASEAPRLKEATAMARAANRLVQELDDAIIDELDDEAYLRVVLKIWLLEASGSDRMRRARGVWGSTPEKARRSLHTLARERSMTEREEVVFQSGLASLTPKAALEELVGWSAQ